MSNVELQLQPVDEAMRDVEIQPQPVDGATRDSEFQLQPVDGATRIVEYQPQPAEEAMAVATEPKLKRKTQRQKTEVAQKKKKPSRKAREKIITKIISQEQTYVDLLLKGVSAYLGMLGTSVNVVSNKVIKIMPAKVIKITFLDLF